MTQIRLDKASFETDSARLLDKVSLTVDTGLTVIIGPNGAGKTTLMKCALGLLAPTSGAAQIDGCDASTLSPAERARKIAYLPQARGVAWPLRVRDVVALGRFAYGGPLGKLDVESESAISGAIGTCGLSALAERHADTLSGGEAARMHFARAFASGAPMLFADEPISALDPAGQLAVMGLLRRHADSGNGALVILHDINLAAAHADRLILMKGGRIVADGMPADVAAPPLISEAFGVTAETLSTGGAPLLRLSSAPEQTGELPKI